MQTMDGYLLHSQGGLRAWTREVKAFKLEYASTFLEFYGHSTIGLYTAEIW